MILVKKAIPVVALVALAACATVTDMWSGGKTVNVNLSGSQEVPPVSSNASGSGSFTVGKDGALKGSVTTKGVQGTMAHIHQGAKGQNGGVIIPLTKSGDTYTVSDDKKLTEAQISAFRAGNLYVNVHSAAHKGGEIRGQLEP
jgi:hypothetical protein